MRDAVDEHLVLLFLLIETVSHLVKRPVDLRDLVGARQKRAACLCPQPAARALSLSTDSRVTTSRKKCRAKNSVAPSIRQSPDHEQPELPASRAGQTLHAILIEPDFVGENLVDSGPHPAEDPAALVKLFVGILLLSLPHEPVLPVEQIQQRIGVGSGSSIRTCCGRLSEASSLSSAIRPLTGSAA